MVGACPLVLIAHNLSYRPFDALPYSPKVKYICVGRDGRDVALSVHNHYSGFTDLAIGLLNSPPGTFNERFERASADVHVFLKGWLTRGNSNFPWRRRAIPAYLIFDRSKASGIIVICLMCS
jgi:aryl sulfotransferase